MSVQIAFYIGNGNLADELIRWRTSSECSHVELVVDGVSYSADPRDGGVRKTVQSFPAEEWVLYNLPEHFRTPILDLFEKTDGAKYDWLSVIIGQGLAIKIRNTEKWFCSEWCAEALGLKESWRYSPGSLMDVVSSIDWTKL